MYEATEDGDGDYVDPGNYAYSDDETLDALLQDYDDEDPQAAEALATFIQTKSNKKVFGTPSTTTAASTLQQRFPFKAHGEMSFEAKGRENCRNAVKFLKTVTPCTSCGRKGHWQGDDECPNKGKKGKGKGPKNFKKAQSHSPQKKKKPATTTTFFVLHDKLESDGDQDNQQTKEASLARAPSTSYEQYLADGVVTS